MHMIYAYEKNDSFITIALENKYCLKMVEKSVEKG